LRRKGKKKVWICPKNLVKGKKKTKAGSEYAPEQKKAAYNRFLRGPEWKKKKKRKNNQSKRPAVSTPKVLCTKKKPGPEPTSWKRVSPRGRVRR